MSCGMFSAIRSLLFIGAFLVAVLLLIPKSVKSWRLWKETSKSGYLSGAVAAGLVAFFLLAADFMIFIITVTGALSE